MSNFSLFFDKLPGMMKDIKIFSLARHRRLFAVPDNSKDYLFVQVTNPPYLEEPYRAESYALAYLKTGSIQFQAGLTVQTLQAPALITVGPTVIRSFSKSSEVMEMDIIFFKESFLLENQADVFFLMKYAFFEQNDQHLMPLTDEYHHKIRSVFELIRLTISRPNLYESSVIRHYLFVIIYEAEGIQQKRTTGTA